MSTDLIVRDEMPLSDLGQMLAKSGYFSDAREAAQCVVKVLAGREMGFGPIASMTGVYIVKGKVSLSANLMAAAVRRSGRYTFLVRELTDKVARIEFFEVVGGKREPLGVSEFTLADAQKAGTQNLDKFPRNMLYARAMSNGVKWFCPDVTGGPIYTPDELGETVNEDGEITTDTPALARHSQVVEVERVPVTPPTPAPDVSALKAALAAAGNEAKAQHAIVSERGDAVLASRLLTAIEDARAVFGKNGKATAAEIETATANLRALIAEAKQATAQEAQPE